MSVGIIILVAFLVFYIIALYCMLVAGSTFDVNPDAAMDNIPEDDKSDKRFRIDIWITVLSIVLFAAGIVVGTMISGGHAADKKTPETGVVDSSIDSTSAPDNPSESLGEDSDKTDESIDILPETEVTIPTEEPTEQESTEPDTTIDPDELEMLACVIYQESGGNSSCDNCRRYVADIVLNRVNHPDFPNTIYEVLTQKGQYGELYWTGIKWPERAKYDVEKDAVARAYRIAEEVLSGQHSKLYGNGYIWQAGFVQGTDGFWCCDHWYGR